MPTYTCHNPACQKPFVKKASLAAQGRGKYCSKACQYAHRPAYKTLETRFWDKVRMCTHGRTCQNCCWLWQGAVQKSGHGIFSIKKDRQWRHISAHAQAWILLHNMEMPEGLMGLHRCNVPGCVNGHHIYMGTHVDNANDARAAGVLFHTNHVRGEAVCTAKLTAADIPVIRQLYQDGHILKEIGMRYGVSFDMIHRIVKRKSWKHIP